MHISRNKSILLLVLALFMTLVLILYGYVLFGYLTGQNSRFWEDSPYNYPGTTWSSDNPEICLIIPEEDITIEESEAWLINKGEKIYIHVFMDAKSSTVDIRPAEDLSTSQRLIVGEKVKCTKDYVVIDVKEDRVFNGEFKLIILRAKNK